MSSIYSISSLLFCLVPRSLCCYRSPFLCRLGMKKRALCNVFVLTILLRLISRAIARSSDPTKETKKPHIYSLSSLLTWDIMMLDFIKIRKSCEESQGLAYNKRCCRDPSHSDVGSTSQRGRPIGELLCATSLQPD